jgi:hypothetical protein
MARGRMLNNSVCGSKQFQDLPDDTCRLLATWLISLLDVQGVFHADPAMVKSSVFPRRTDITIEQVAGYLDVLEELGLIVRYISDGDLWLHWPGFARNQVGLRADRESPQFPAPPTNDGEAPEYSGEQPEECRNETDEFPAEEKLSEEKRSEEKLSEEKLAPPAAAIPPKPPKKPTPPAVQVFRENAHRYPPKAWYGDIAGTVGEGKAELARWGAVVKAYVGCGWNPTNVSGMLDFFQRGEIPKPGKRAPPDAPQTPEERRKRYASQPGVIT